MAIVIGSRFCRFGSTSSKIGWMSDGERGRGGAVQHHGGQRCGQPRAMRARVFEQSAKGVHSLNRYLSSTHSATTPSRQPIFLPSSYPRPSYVMGTS